MAFLLDDNSSYITGTVIDINGGLEMRAWYDITGREIASAEDERGIRESAKLVEEHLARERARGVPSERILLGGFSQGGAMTWRFICAHADLLASAAPAAEAACPFTAADSPSRQ